MNFQFSLTILGNYRNRKNRRKDLSIFYYRFLSLYQPMYKYILALESESLFDSS